jgi:hypothetical protein
MNDQGDEYNDSHASRRDKEEREAEQEEAL